MRRLWFWLLNRTERYWAKWTKHLPNDCLCEGTLVIRSVNTGNVGATTECACWCHLTWIARLKREWCYRRHNNVEHPFVGRQGVIECWICQTRWLY